MLKLLFLNNMKK